MTPVNLQELIDFEQIDLRLAMDQRDLTYFAHSVVLGLREDRTLSQRFELRVVRRMSRSAQEHLVHYSLMVSEGWNY